MADDADVLSSSGAGKRAMRVLLHGKAGGKPATLPIQETTVTPAAVTLIANTAKALLAANANRIRFTIINPLATDLFVRKALLATSAATVAAGGYDIRIPPGGIYISDPGEYAGAINGICATAGDVGVSESI